MLVEAYEDKTINININNNMIAWLIQLLTANDTFHGVAEQLA